MKKFKVLVPYSSLCEGDILEPNEDGSYYTAEHSEEFNKTGVNGETFASSVSYTVTFSADYVNNLVENGYLEEIDDTFVNVFDEIDKLLNMYENELKEVEADKDPVPACLKVEKTTVLTNLIKVLNHLKSLKK